MRIHRAHKSTATEHLGRVTVVRSASPSPRLTGDGASSLGARRARGDAGYTLALSALLIIPLMVFLAFAVDLGAWYGQASKVQRAADAAAMAGVVWLPDSAKASTEASNAARANGITSGATFAPVGSNQYQVTVSKPAPRFFSTVFGQSSFNITRSAIAQFNKPIPLGSPAAKFGNDITASCAQSQPTLTAPCGPQPMMWSAINGAYAPLANGDPYATKCAAGNNGGTNCTQGNPNYRTSGYDYAIDIDPIDVNKPITIQAYDVGVYTRTITPGTYNSNNNSWNNATTVPEGGTGNQRDCNRGLAPFNTSIYYRGGTNSQYWDDSFSTNNCQTGDSGAQMNMDFQLYQNDGSDLSIDISTIYPDANCHKQWDTSALNVTATFKNKWVTVCTFTPSISGIFPLKVRNSGFGTPADAGDGTNAYALKITGGTTSHVYALNDMSIYTNAPGSSATFYLAEIKPEHAGKKLQIDLYDPGDGNNSTTPYLLQIKAPAAGAPSPVPTSGTVIPTAGVASLCKYNQTPSATKGPAVPDTAASCTVTTKNANSGGGGIYNGNWLRIEVQIDPAYTCGSGAVPDCWWTVKYDFGQFGFPTDRTTWSIKVVGDPVHLIK